MYVLVFFFFFQQKTAYEMRISDWSSVVCSSDLRCSCRRASSSCRRGRGASSTSSTASCRATAPSTSARAPSSCASPTGCARGCAQGKAMTTEALSPPGFAYRGAMVRAFAGRSGPLAVVCLAILVLWYAGAVWLNAPVLIDGYERRNEAWDLGRLAGDAMAMERPILPAPPPP